MSGAAGVGGGDGMVVGSYYPMFAVKLANGKNDDTSNPPASDFIEVPMRRALSFNENNTTTLNGSETTATIKSILDSNRYTCNPTFKTSTTTISGIKIIHYTASGSDLSEENNGQFEFDGSAFNIYDHACNAATNVDSGAWLDGNAISSPSLGGGTDHIFVNCSTKTSRGGDTNWGSDGGDYCFLGISDKTTSGDDSDSLDTEFGTNASQGTQSRALAFGISDSDGAPTNSQAPKDGISRRSNNYWSLCSNWRVKDANDNATHNDNQVLHSGNTITGYFVVYGKLKAMA